MKDKFDITIKINNEMISCIHNLFINEWWTNKRTIEDTKRIIDNSTISFCLIEKQTKKMIGFTRVLTDFNDTALILDVIINSNYRNQGLGQYMLDYITHYPDFKNVDKFDLHCKTDLEEFYGKSNFIRTPEMIWLRKNN